MLRFREKIIGPFCFKNKFNLTHDSFKKIILLKFLVKIVIQKLMFLSDAFSRRNSSFNFYSTTRISETKVLIIYYCFNL